MRVPQTRVLSRRFFFYVVVPGERCTRKSGRPALKRESARITRNFRFGIYARGDLNAAINTKVSKQNMQSLQRRASSY